MKNKGETEVSQQLTTGLEQTVRDFRTFVKKMTDYNEAVSLMAWDLRTGAPRKGVAQRSEVIGMLSTEVFKMSVSAEMEAYLETLSTPDNLSQLDEITRATVLDCKKDFDRMKSIPSDWYQEYVVLTSNAQTIWEEAKSKNDFAMFQPYLEKIVQKSIEFVEFLGYEGNKYNTLLDLYEPGIKVEQLDEIFANLRISTIELLDKIRNSGNDPRADFLNRTYDTSKQKEFSIFLLEQMGYDFEAGRLDESVHPFATGLNPGDVRVTTHFYLDELRSGIFGTIHEGGHALYEQNVSKDLIGTPLASGTSMGIHESQSRYWENTIGRSKAFWERYYQDLLNRFPEQLNDVTMDEFFRAVNRVTPSLIRIEADELTYNLHIMIRFEIEKGLINGTIQVADLPRLWNEKYQEYLGIEPDSNATGVLQDVHWSGGMFGYFPSYSLGNIYAAQFTNALKKDIPNIDELVSQGNLAPIKAWYGEKIHKYGKLLTPAEIVKQVTGEEITSKYLVEYLTEKYQQIYQF
jgi:carboxypeptidase Taq